MSKSNNFTGKNNLMSKNDIIEDKATIDLM